MMRNIIYLISWLAAQLALATLFPVHCFADILYFKNGDRLEGDIINRTYDSIIVRIADSSKAAAAARDSGDLTQDREIYFYDIDKIQYDSGIIEIVSKMSRVSVDKAPVDANPLSVEYDETAKLVKFELKKDSLLKPFVKVMVENTAGIKVPVNPDINIENKDGVIVDHMQKREIILEKGLEVCYIGLGPSGVEFTPLIYRVENIEIDAEKTAFITLRLGETVSQWKTSSGG
ncbi:hypothetical protein ACFL1D_01220 [Candidatus Omnitrophota bacterium]